MVISQIGVLRMKWKRNQKTNVEKNESVIPSSFSTKMFCEVKIISNGLL